MTTCERDDNRSRAYRSANKRVQAVRLTACKATRFGRVHPTSGKGTSREEKVSMEVFQDLGQSSPYKGHPKDGSMSFTIPLRRACKQTPLDTFPPEWQPAITLAL